MVPVALDCTSLHIARHCLQINKLCISYTYTRNTKEKRRKPSTLLMVILMPVGWLSNESWALEPVIHCTVTVLSTGWNKDWVVTSCWLINWLIDPFIHLTAIRLVPPRVSWPTLTAYAQLYNTVCCCMMLQSTREIAHAVLRWQVASRVVFVARLSLKPIQLLCLSWLSHKDSVRSSHRRQSYIRVGL